MYSFRLTDYVILNIRTIMVIVKRIVCFANSRKMSERCVAGKEWTADSCGPWIRPVGNRPMGELLPHERKYKDGSEPQLLDVIDVPLKGPQPRTFHSENWLLEPNSRWSLAGRAKWSDLSRLVDDPPALWLNISSTRAGLNDRVATTAAHCLDTSLYLLHLASLKLRVFAPAEDLGQRKRKVQAEFAHRGTEYRFWVTDPIVERVYLAKADGDYDVGECFITVSLGEPHKGDCYKLVAAIMTPNRDRR